MRFLSSKAVEPIECRIIKNGLMSMEDAPRLGLTLTEICYKINFGVQSGVNDVNFGLILDRL